MTTYKNRVIETVQVEGHAKHEFTATINGVYYSGISANTEAEAIEKAKCKIDLLTQKKSLKHD